MTDRPEEPGKPSRAKTFFVLAGMWAVIAIIPTIILVRGFQTGFAPVHYVSAFLAAPLPIFLLIGIILAILKK